MANEKSTALSWGKPTLNIGKLADNGSAPTSFKRIPTPVVDSTKLTPTKGQKMEAKVEGGANEAVKYAANTYTFEFEIRKTDAKDIPVEDFDGVVGGEYSIQLIPEDGKALGFIIDKSAMSVEDTYDAANGAKLKFTCDVLKPSEGKQVKWEVQADKCPVALPLVVAPVALNLAAVASAAAGESLTVTATGNITLARATAGADWITVTKAAKVATIKVAANANSAARSCVVTLEADGRSVDVAVTQAGA